MELCFECQLPEIAAFCLSISRNTFFVTQTYSMKCIVNGSCIRLLSNLNLSPRENKHIT